MLRVTKTLLGALLFMFFFLFVVGVVSNASGRTSATVSPSPAKAISPSPVSTGSPSQTVNEQLGRIEQEIKDLKQQPKDFWGKISSISPLISGVLVAMIGAIATYVFSKRQRTGQEQDLNRQIAADETRSQREMRIEQVKTVEAFIPHLGSRDAREREAALVVLSTLGLEDPDLVIKLATMYKDEGGEAALARLATSPDETVAAAARHSITAFYNLLKSSVVKVLTKDKARVGSGFAVANGRLIVTADYVVKPSVEESTEQGSLLDIQTSDGVSFEAMLQSVHPEYGIAFLQLKDASLVPMELTMNEDLELLAPVVLLMCGEFGWQSSSGSVDGIRRGTSSKNVIEPLIVIRPASDIGSGGGPVVDRTGKVVGMIRGINKDKNLTFAIPSSLIARAIPVETGGSSIGNK